MGTSASENIAIGITTSAELSGTRAARGDLGALGQEAQKTQQQFDKTNTSAKAAGTAIGAASKEATGALGAASTAAAGLANSVQFQIGAFEALGKKIDVGNAAAVQGYRAQGDALSANLVKLGATDAELNRIGTAIAKVERSAGASLLDPKSPQAIELGRLPTKTRTAANALGVLSQAALTGQGSLAGAATAAGNLATGLAAVATNAKIAAGATAIGAIITILSVGYGIVHSYTEKTKELNHELEDLSSKGRGLDDAIAGKDLAQRLEQINRQADKEIEQAKEIKFHGEQRAKIIAQINANRTREIQLAETQFRNEAAARSQERNQAIAFGALQETLESDRAAGKKTDYQLQLQANEAQRLQRATEIDQQFRRRSASGELIALTNEEIDQRDELLRQNDAIAHSLGEQLRLEQQLTLQANTARRLQGSDSLTDRVQGRLEEIELERQAEIKRTGDVYNATLEAEHKKRQLYRETAREANENAKTIFEVLRSTNDKTLKAVGTFGENLRRIVVGAEAARALVRAAVEGAEAVASLAIGDFRGAALHGAAAVQFGAAAALGARESLGGGGGSGGGGAGGSGSAAVGSTYATPARNEGSPVVVNLYTTDPFGRENIMVASWQLQRAGITKRPIYVPPTTGFYAQPA